MKFQTFQTTITNQSGTLEQELSFDAWGNLRNPNTWGNTSITPMFDRGFTGHEHLYGFGLINMNGRMYDPTMSMMLSPDNYIQSPDFSQNFNRYSYCLNNSLRFTDPSGEVIEWVAIASIAAFTAFSAGLKATYDYENGNYNGNMKEIEYVSSMAAVGALSGAIGGLAGQAAGGAVTVGGFYGGAVTGGVGGAVGGFIGGAGNTWANGGDFMSGIGSGVISGFVGGVAGGLLGGTIRGICDYSYGNDFWDGSRIDAFVIGNSAVEGAEEFGNLYNASEQATYNDEILQERIYDEFGVSKGDFNIKDITTKVDNKYGMTQKGLYVNKKGELTGGYNFYKNGQNHIHISPYYSNGDIIDFRAVAGHELTHAYHHYIIPVNCSDLYSERAAYRYTYNVYKSNGRYGLDMLRLLYRGSGYYPPQYQIPSIFKFY